jgi:hypothetical protein
MSKNEGTGLYIQVRNDDWDDLNRALRYLYDQVDALSGRRGNVPLGNDLNLNGHRAVGAADPKDPADLVTLEYANANFSPPAIQQQLLIGGTAPLLSPLLGQGSPVFLESDHADRPDAGSYGVGSALWELDRTVTYINELNASNIQIWKYHSGQMIDAIANRPADLGVDDSGFKFFQTDNLIQTEYLWTGTSWITVGGAIQSVSDSATNTPTTALNLVHLTSAAAATNFAVRENFQLHNSAGQVKDAGAMDVLWDVPTGGNEGSRFRFLLMRSGASAVSCFEFNKAVALLQGTLFWFSGGSFSGQLFHSNSADRSYTFPDADGNIPYESGAIGFGNIAVGGGGALLLDSGVAFPTITGTTLGLAALTGGGSPGSISFNNQGLIIGYSAPT